ncbi:hypothetical protein AAC691_10300 [Nguyenibacter vanlangensis]|uniref:Uncharacterized protein n=1 Tax=Nguyenibacter vanlangensis TaxID=1216886 RepID=A0ABZ3DAE4_9PROT
MGAQLTAEEIRSVSDRLAGALDYRIDIRDIVQDDGTPLHAAATFPVGTRHEETFAFSAAVGGVLVNGRMLANDTGFALLDGAWRATCGGREVEQKVAGTGTIEDAEWVPVDLHHLHGRAGKEVREWLVSEAVRYLIETLDAELANLA